MIIPSAIPTLEEAQELFSDVYFVQKGFRPLYELGTAGRGDSTWYLRCRTEELLAMMVEEFRDKKHH